MLQKWLSAVLSVIFVFFVCAMGVFHMSVGKGRGVVVLSKPLFKSATSIESAIKMRRSVRSYQKTPLTKEDVSQILWSAQGVTSPQGLRTAPSAGALYPIEVYVAIGNVEGMDPGIYQYKPVRHELQKMVDGDKRVDLCKASLEQDCVERGAIVVVVCADHQRTMKKYGDRGRLYVDMEVGCVAQNIYLQTVSLKLGTVFVGAFDEGAIKKIIGFSSSEIPRCVMPIGKK